MEYFVGNNRDFETLAAAARVVKPGDTVTVFEGTYREALVCNTPGVTWQSAVGHKPVIDGGWDGTTVEGTFGGVISCPAEGVVVDGLSVRNAPGRGIGIGASNVTVRNCWVDNTYKGGLGANAPAGKVISGLLIENNVFTRLGQERVVTKGGRVNGSCLFAQVVDSVVRGNVVANGLGEGINIDRGSARLLVEKNMVINSAHVGIYINRASDNEVRGNVVIYTGVAKPVGKVDDAPAGIIIGDESGGGSWPPSSGNRIVGNVVVGSGKLFQVRNNAHNYDTQLDAGTEVSGNTFVAKSLTTAGIDVKANVQGRPHGAARFFDNVIEFTYAAGVADVGTNSTSAIDFHHNAWSEEPPMKMRGEGDVYGELGLWKPWAPLTGDWVGVETGFDIDNYRPVGGQESARSPLIGAASDGGTMGALEAVGDEPPVEPPPTDPPVPDYGWLVVELEGQRVKLGRAAAEVESAVLGLEELIGRLEGLKG